MAEDTPDLEPVYVWDVVVRSTHWLIVIGILVLSLTGFYIGHPFIVAPGEASQHFIMGYTKAIHSYAAIVFTLAVLSRIVWMFIGSPYARWQQLIPTARERRRGLVETLWFYLFLRREPPAAVGHNPLAGFAYVFVFLLFMLMIATGLGLYGMSARPGGMMHAFAPFVSLFGGAQLSRWFHHASMWLLLGFSFHHVYSAWLVAVTEKNGTLDSIFSGWKYLRKKAPPP